MKVLCETRHIVIAEPAACAPVSVYEIEIDVTTAQGKQRAIDSVATQHGAEEAAYRLFLHCQAEADRRHHSHPEEYEIIAARVIYRAEITTIKHPELLNIAMFPQFKPEPAAAARPPKQEAA